MGESHTLAKKPFRFTTWARTESVVPATVDFPKNTEELIAVVNDSRTKKQKLKVCHCHLRGAHVLLVCRYLAVDIHLRILQFRNSA